jgi:hypothetical protein
MDPQLGRFTQADSIIPESQGVQAWDRYAFVNNNPVLHNDPTGHCFDMVSCLTEDVMGLALAAGYLALTAVKNGRVTKADWTTAADFGLPPDPIAAGSKIEAGLIASAGAASPAAVSFVTTKDGDAQLFFESGFGEATPQADGYVTYGKIYGDLTSASKYGGGAAQLSGGLSDGLPGVTAAYWASSDGKIRGVDVGFTFGPGLPTSVALMGTYAKPATFKGNEIKYKLTGPTLLACRALFMCGR